MRGYFGYKEHGEGFVSVSTGCTYNNSDNEKYGCLLYFQYGNMVRGDGVLAILYCFFRS